MGECIIILTNVQMGRWMSTNVTTVVMTVIICVEGVIWRMVTFPFLSGKEEERKGCRGFESWTSRFEWWLDKDYWGLWRWRCNFLESGHLIYWSTEWETFLGNKLVLQVYNIKMNELKVDHKTMMDPPNDSSYDFAHDQSW